MRSSKFLSSASCSVAGLWTARVAADHFEDVLVIESEAWVGADAGKANAYDVDGVQINGQGEQVRSRIPQYTAVHGELFNTICLAHMYTESEMEQDSSRFNSRFCGSISQMWIKRSRAWTAGERYFCSH